MTLSDYHWFIDYDSDSCFNISIILIVILQQCQELSIENLHLTKLIVIVLDVVLRRTVFVHQMLIFQSFRISLTELCLMSTYFVSCIYNEIKREKILRDGESNPGLPRDRRGYSPLYYRGVIKIYQNLVPEQLRFFYQILHGENREASYDRTMWVILFCHVLK